jgi:hypothetical protein
MAEKEKKEKTELRKRFEKSKYAVSAYAQAIGVTKEMLSGVLDGKFNGKKAHRGGTSRVIILELQKDGIWQDELPWKVE